MRSLDLVLLCCCSKRAAKLAASVQFSDDVIIVYIGKSNPCHSTLKAGMSSLGSFTTRQLSNPSEDITAFLEIAMPRKSCF